MFDVSEVVNIQLVEKDRERLTQIIKEFVGLSHKARVEGILSLESEISRLMPFLLRKGIELVVDGNLPKQVREILNRFIASGKYTGIELLERLIIREGVLLIQTGCCPKLLLNTISSMLGEEFSLYIEGLELLKSDEQFFMNNLENNSFPALDGSGLLEENVTQIHNFEDMEALIRRVGTFDFALALRGASSDSIKHVFYHIGSRGILEDIKLIMKGPCRLIDIQEAQKKVVKAIHI